MDLFKLENWCSRAVRLIRYRPDRNAVYAELYQHLEDRCASFTAKGIPEEEAKEMAVAAMGNPDEIAPQLAAIHRPFWGYCYRVTKWVLVLVAVVTLFHAFFFLTDEILQNDPPYDFYAEEPDGYWVRTSRAYYAEPNLSATLDGFRVTVRKVALRHGTSDPIHPDVIYLRLRITKPVPWADKPDMYLWFRAVDSLGNTYRSYAETDHSSPSLVACDVNYDPFGITFDLKLDNCVSRNAEWIELHYDRNGRDFVLRIDLTGGDVS